MLWYIEFEKLKKGAWPFVFILLTEILQMNNCALCIIGGNWVLWSHNCSGCWCRWRGGAWRSSFLTTPSVHSTWRSGCYDSSLMDWFPGVFVWANLCSASELSWEVYWLFWVHSSSVAEARRWEKATKTKIADTKKWACVDDVRFSLSV